MIRSLLTGTDLCVGCGFTHELLCKRSFVLVTLTLFWNSELLIFSSFGNWSRNVELSENGEIGSTLDSGGVQ